MTHVVMGASHGRHVGGTETHLLDLVWALAHSGDRVTVVHRSPGHAVVPGVEFVHVPIDADAGPVLSDLAPDIVHVHGEGLRPQEAQAQRRRRPVVRSLHDWSVNCSSGTLLRNGDAACPRAHGPGCLLHIINRSCTERPNPLPALGRWRALGAVRKEVEQAMAVVVYSEYAREVAIRNGIAPDRCHVLPYFVDAAVAATPPAGDGRVCFVGRLTKLKGVDLLLEAVARSRRVTHLEVVGDGYYGNELARLADRLDIASRVTFSGWMDPGATQSAMHAADLVAVPSIWPEPFGIVGLEAMAASRGVIASGSGGIPDWLKDGETGRIVRSPDAASWATALDEAIENKSLLARWSAAGAREVRRFSREHHLRALRSIYAAIATR